MDEQLIIELLASLRRTEELLCDIARRLEANRQLEIPRQILADLEAFNFWLRSFASNIPDEAFSVSKLVLH